MKTYHYVIAAAVAALVLYVLLRKPNKAAASQRPAPGTPIGTAKDAPRDGSARSRDELEVTKANMQIPVMAPIVTAPETQPQGFVAQPNTVSTAHSDKRVTAPIAVVGLSNDV